MQFFINTLFWFQKWVPLFVNYAEKNSPRGQICQDIKNPIKMKHSPVIHVTSLPIQNEVWMSIEIGFIALSYILVTNVLNHLPANKNKIYSDKSTFQTNKRKRKLDI